ncbi:ferrochelatase [Paenibacillus puerhi]|uniref:ferrochelatase n=1 Tax=Paenibacillus puerhi TaxID=2692622 RepID=UPI001F25987D|nr:ferrochelatase [Paenibacillus puerhi]
MTMKAVLCMSYCLLRSIDDIPAFYSHLYHGRPPSTESLQEASRRYRELGEPDPLGVVTLRQAKALERRLKLRFREDIPVYTAFKHTPPYIEDAVREITGRGVEHIYTLPLSPLYSRTGVKSYQQEVRKAREACSASFQITDIDRWHLHPGFTTALALRVQEAMQWISHVNRARTVVIFTTHSMPGLPGPNRDYIRAFSELAHAVAKLANCPHWKLGYRSGGSAPQTWLGPDLLDMMEQSVREGWSAVVVCDLLSITQNIETLQDCRYDGQAKAEQLGIEFVSTSFLNDSDDGMTALEEIVAGYISKKNLAEDYR